MRKMAIKVPDVARSVLPNPTAMPIPAVIHISAAVVNPDTPMLRSKNCTCTDKSDSRDDLSRYSGRISHTELIKAA